MNGRHWVTMVTFVVATAWSPAQSTADDIPMLIDGIAVDCKKAVEFRDTRLIGELNLFYNNYDADKAKREAKVLEILNKRLANLDKYWNNADDENRKRIISTLVSFTLVVGGEATSRVAKARPGLSEETKQALDIIIDRSAASADLIQKAGFESASIADASSFTVGAVISVVAPPVRGWWFGYQFAEASTNLAVALDDLTGDRKLHEKSADDVKEAMRKIARKSVSGKIGEVNLLKEEIDTACAAL